MNTADANFYTVKQIDDFLKTDEILAQSTSDSGKWFALQHTRNILIDRLKTRLAIANGCDCAITGSKRADVLLDKGFYNYENLCKHIHTSYGYSKDPWRPSQETEDSLRGFMAALLDNIAGISKAKFVFCDEPTTRKLPFKVAKWTNMYPRGVDVTEGEVITIVAEFEK